MPSFVPIETTSAFLDTIPICPGSMILCRDTGAVYFDTSTGIRVHALATSGSKKVVKASEALSAGNLVNIYFDTDTWYCRKADASDVEKYAVGFVAEAFESDADAEVHLYGEFEVISELNEVYLTQTPGVAGAYDPTAAIRQLIGRRTGSNTFKFLQGEIVIL